MKKEFSIIIWVYVIIAAFGISPLVFAFALMPIDKDYGTLHWYFLVTGPIAGLLLVAWTIGVLLYYLVKLLKNKNNQI